MEPAEVAQGVDARPERSLTATDPVSKVLNDDDLLIEILLRLTPKPSFLRNASLIYKRWRRILFDPQFLGRFRKHHWKLLGFFYQQFDEAPIFTPISDQLDVIAAAWPENLFDPYSLGGVFLGCRDGIALVLNRARHEAIIWEPTTGGKNHVAFPPAVTDGFETSVVSAAVMCSARDVHQHLHNENCLSTFKLVLVCHEDFANQKKVSVCLYDSKSNTWGDIISITDTCKIANVARPSVMVGNALYWLLSGANILEFDFERQTLVVIEKPTAYAHVTGSSVDMSFQILRGEDNCPGLAVLSKLKLSIELWGRKSNGDGIVSWVLQKCVQLDELFSRPARRKNVILLAGYDEDTNAIFLSSDSHDFILQLESVQFRYIGRRECTNFRMYYPYTNFYIAADGKREEGAATDTMEPVEIPQGVDARPGCSLTPTDPVSKVLSDDDLLIEILLRLTPKPSSLRNASLIYKQWRRILFDPQFLGRFRKHHWKLLGFFYQQFNEAPIFTPISDQLGLIAVALPENLSGPYSLGGVFLGCRDGITLVLDRARHKAIICEPTTGGKNHVTFPTAVSHGFDTSVVSAAVMCSARDVHQHLHNENCLNTFKLVLVCQEDFANQTKVSVCLYDSKSNTWGDIISIMDTCKIANVARPSVMVGNALYWLLSGANILEFDCGRKTLVVIEKPTTYAHVTGSSVDMSFQIL
ncbi:uncharacterized protein LOC119326784 [Triticum dicoccoides]|uniref:uncharacterized protein LOC119326784 n=1 Tax=Triticum dicoccoides TaxID=85692 RepID=UPI001891A921|nr:uncharacterized protein LOC119326784 [Triticum dicoccoides]